MSELKDLVPPLEDCQRIPQGAFPDSVLVWAYTGNGYEVTSREVWSIVESIFTGISAPTLEEIMAALLAMDDLCKYPELNHDCDTDWTVRVFVPGAMIHERDEKSSATAALRLWMRLQEK